MTPVALKTKAKGAKAAFLQLAHGKYSSVNVSLGFFNSTLLSLRFLSASYSAGGRLETARRGGECVRLEVQFLLQDPAQDELGSDDGDGRQQGRSA